MTNWRCPGGDFPVLAFGGGINSSALAILLVQRGWRGHIVFANTGAEWPETYQFVFRHFRPWLRQHGLDLITLGREYRSRRYSLPLPVAMRKYRMIPLARARWCTTEYKIRPMHRWLSQKGFQESDVMIAIAADEAHRQPDKIRPLVDWGISRDDCARIIIDSGLPLPPKSGCWMCPFQSRTQWRFLRLRHPNLFALALELEQITGATFDPSGELPLASYVCQNELFDWSELYQPCLCRV